MKKTLVLIGLLPLLLLSCSSETAIEGPVTPAVPIVLKASLRQRVNQDNAFAFDLLQKTMDLSGETNVFVSPLSMSLAFGMARNGAAGTTKSEIDAALKLSGLSESDINEYYRIMQQNLPVIDPKTSLSIANSVWFEKKFSIKTDFLNINQQNFNAYVKAMDFSASWAKDTINNWCSKKTRGLIPKIIDNIQPNEKLFLINAVYFKGSWSQKFDKAKTQEFPFVAENKTSITVNMMSRLDTFPYYQNTTAQYLDMPYGNGAFSMTVILPAEGQTPASVLKTLPASWNGIVSSLSAMKVDVHFPRFKVENSFVMNPELQAMGMTSAFTDAANFSGISDQALFISKVLQKTYVAVDEDGTEAAAVTSIGIAMTSMPSYPVFFVNKPFLFVIREKSTGVILFIGKMGAVSKY